MPVEYLASKDEFDAALEATKNGGIPLIIDFTATWCPPCKAIAPKFEAMADEFKGKMTFRKVDVDAN